MRIGFYINPVARLREQHPSGLPDPALAAALAESAGAQVILAGWAPGSGILNERDILLTRELVRGDLFVVTALREDTVESILKFHPDGVILIDTTWDGVRQGRSIPIDADADLVAAICSSFKAAAVPAAVMIEPNAQAVRTAARIGASGVVIDCSIYAAARTEKDAEESIDRISSAAMAAGKFGMVASAARGLTSANVSPVSRLSYIEELYFGQSIVARALLVGLDASIRELIASSRHAKVSS